MQVYLGASRLLSNTTYVVLLGRDGLNNESVLLVLFLSKCRRNLDLEFDSVDFLDEFLCYKVLLYEGIMLRRDFVFGDAYRDLKEAQVKWPGTL